MVTMHIDASMQMYARSWWLAKGKFLYFLCTQIFFEARFLLYPES